ncbi:hypothetical protein GCM10023144_04240 [Pigmentiphaga soli]|uniref:beta-lactamase n=1 Tax=Pigmentiphaga soli TaxID=1007095 RepID=A0ABP8GFY7_9BURK
MDTPNRPCLLLLCSLALLAASPARAADWTDALEERIAQIDRDSPGQIGVYVKRLEDGKRMAYQSGRMWYLGSSEKVPIALAVLQEVEDGRHRLDEKATLQDGDRVDGSGKLVWQETGTRYSVDELLENMLMQSDNTAANMLVRVIGEDTLNRRARDYLGRRGFRQLTSLAEVRYAVYSELHPDARKLSNLDLVKLAAAPIGPQRVAAFLRMTSLERDELRVPTLDEAYGRYYARELNSATLEAYGDMLEQLVRGKLVSADHMRLLYGYMKYDSYDAYRLEAGLPRTVRFIHKTGTQYRRACHMGVIDPQRGEHGAIVVAACAQDLDEATQAGRTFERVGRAIAQALLNGGDNDGRGDR